MNRVEAAIQEGRCVVAVGGRALNNPDVLMELRRRSALPSVALGGDAVDPVAAISAEALAPVLAGSGGVLVLVEPEAGDGRALGELDRLIKAAKNKPRLVVAARAWNPFSMPMNMRLMKTEQVKQRAQDFLGSLPVPQVAVATYAAAVEAAPDPQDDRHRAALPELVGRVDELARLKQALADDGGPIIVNGPAGIGKRWLVEAALDEDERTRLPDLTFGRGVGADTLLIRLAIAARSLGDERLHQALSSAEGPSPSDMAALVVEVLQAEGFADRVMVLNSFELLLGNESNSLFRNGRLELVLRALLCNPLALRLIIVSQRPPELHAEGLSQHLRRIELRGLPATDVAVLFEKWHAQEGDAPSFETVTERTFGHPMAGRSIAIDARTTPLEELVEQPRYLKATALDEFGALERNLRRRIKELDKEHFNALCAAAMLRDPGNPEELNLLGVRREVRIELMARGLLEQTPVRRGRKYYVHPLVAGLLDRRKVEDFARMEEVGNYFLGRSRDLRKDGDDTASIAYALEGNRLLIGARRSRSTVQLPYPDMDAVLDDLYALIRRKNGPRLDIARMRVNECRKLAPNNPELLLAEAELLVREKAKVPVVEDAFRHAADVAPTPEVYHRVASWYLERNQHDSAINALQAGATTFPLDARLRRRLGGLLMDGGRFDDAVTTLKEARDLEPMMADSYSLLGEVYVAMGQEHWATAAEVLDEARDLAPDEPQHQLRQALLLQARGAADAETRDSLWEQAEQLARTAWQELYRTNRRGDHHEVKAAVLLAELTLSRTAVLDKTRLEQAEYVLKQTMKRRRETPEVIVQRARVLTHRESWREVEELLDRALSKAPGLAAAYAARGEVWEAQHQPFHAFEAWKAAQSLSQEGTTAWLLAQEHVERLKVLIESGMAATIMKEKGVEKAEDPAAAGTAPVKARRTRRRRKGQEVSDEEADAAQADGTAAPAADDDAAPAAEGAVQALPAVDDTDATAAPLQAAEEGPTSTDDESQDETSSTSTSSAPVVAAPQAAPEPEALPAPEDEAAPEG